MDDGLDGYGKIYFGTWAALTLGLFTYSADPDPAGFLVIAAFVAVPCVLLAAIVTMVWNALSA